jgi:hypothetical protein
MCHFECKSNKVVAHCTSACTPLRLDRWQYYQRGGVYDSSLLSKFVIDRTGKIDIGEFGAQDSPRLCLTSTLSSEFPWDVALFGNYDDEKSKYTHYKARNQKDF